MQDHIAQLTAMLQEAHQQNRRLLDLRRTPPPASPQEAPGAAQPRQRVPRGPPGRQCMPQRPPAAQDGDPTRGHAPAHRGPAPGPP